MEKVNLDKIPKKLIIILIVFLIFPLFISCDSKEKSLVEKICEKNSDYKKCLTNKEFFLQSALTNWKPTMFNKIGLSNVKKRNVNSNNWIGENINYKNAIKIDSLEKIKISYSSYPNLKDEEEFIAGEKLKKNVYLFEGLVTFCNDTRINKLPFYCPEGEFLLLDINHENSSNKSLSFRRFGLTSKDLDILKLCQIKFFSVNKDSLICRGQFLISIEIRGVSYTDLKHLNYYLESFKLYNDDIDKKISLLKKNRKDLLSAKFDIHLDEMINN
jgi:hypothetical protein